MRIGAANFPHDGLVNNGAFGGLGYKKIALLLFGMIREIRSYRYLYVENKLTYHLQKQSWAAERVQKEIVATIPLITSY